MKNSKLVILLSSLSQKEHSLLKRFLCSKIYNQNALVIALFDHLRKQFKSTKPDFSKEGIYKAVFDT